LDGKPERNRLLGRPRHREEDNIKMNVTGVWYEVWTGFIWLRIDTDGGVTPTSYLIFGFHKTKRIL
jgi:hypothetical protein